ncbi:MAG: glycosyltransferase family 4 protein [Clostridia bacterium]|nr:glycosyltransferase family 4 protein [Clostridia bacterium]
MKILVLTTMPVKLDSEGYFNKSKSSGGWIGMLVNNIQKSDKVDKAAIVSVNPANDGSVDEVGNVKSFSIKSRIVTWRPQKQLIARFQEILDEFKPDIIDIQGIEFTVGRDLLMCRHDAKVIATLQGIPAELSKVYFCAMPKGFRHRRSFYDLTHFKGLAEKQRLMRMRGRSSHEILKKADYVIGRTDWDHANSWYVNPGAEYFYVPRAFRDDFYKEENKWKLEDVKRHRIFGIQGRDSAKGLHVALEALALLKGSYPDVELIVPGDYKYNSSKKKITAYEKYIRGLISKYSLEQNVKFVGSLSAAEMADYMKTSHIFCQYSLCENSPNSLGEAMMLGVPCVASFVGGTSTYLHHDRSGLMYEKGEMQTLAFMIKKIFDDDELALRLSENARAEAFERNSPEKSKNCLFGVYEKIISQNDEVKAR